MIVQPFTKKRIFNAKEKAKQFSTGLNS